jgi:hypothetical protein
MANNNSVDEYLVYLKENAQELRQLGKKWGMTEKEIDNCVTEALSLTENKEDLKKSPKNIARKCWAYFLFLIKIQLGIGLLLMVLLGGMYTTALYHEPSQRAIMKAIMPYSYEIMRAVRLAAVPLHKMFNISSMLIDLYIINCTLIKPYML